MGASFDNLGGVVHVTRAPGTTPAGASGVLGPVDQAGAVFFFTPFVDDRHCCGRVLCGLLTRVGVLGGDQGVLLLARVFG